MIFTTSWDDGYALDLDLADMLRKYGCVGTFYASPVQQYGEPMLTSEQIKSLAADMEIGAHSMTHPELAKASRERAAKELRESKAWIEDMTGRPCRMFCYPKGSHNAETKEEARAAGYLGARTVEMLRFDVADPYAMPTSLHAYPFPWRGAYKAWEHYLDPLSALRIHRKRLDDLGIAWKDRWSWLSLAKALFAKALEIDRPVFHLWGHSAEVKRMGMWNDLDSFLAFVATHPGIVHKANGDVIASLSRP